MQLIQQLGLSKNAFAQSLDKTATVIQHIVDERNKPGYDLLCKVFEVYPNVSKEWLMLGQGPMLPEATPPELFASAELAAATKAVPGAALSVARTSAAAEPEADELLTSNTAPLPPTQPPVAPPVQSPAPASSLVAPPPTAASATPDATYVAAMLQAQHLQHQLALAEQRNQHLLEQQQLLQQMVTLLQKA